MLRFEVIEGLASELTSTPVKRPQFPLYVEPAPEEALLSWLLRLASRLGVSLRALTTSGFGFDDRAVGLQWWSRPRRWLLARISQRTGVGLARLQQMTFEGLQPAYRDDEASGRFTGRRYDTRAVESRGYRFSVCGPCFKHDATPYLRRLWLIGWTAACPDHGTILIERCTACHARLRVAAFSMRAPFLPDRCVRCGERLLDGPDALGHPSVVRLQAALLKAKSQGFAEFDGLGQLTWKEIVALADVLIGTVWTDLTVDEQEQLWISYMHAFRDEPQEPTEIFEGRHDSLCFLAWLLGGWPHGEGPSIARDLLVRWLGEERNRLCRHLRPPWTDPWTSGPSNFEPPIFERLRALADVR